MWSCSKRSRGRCRGFWRSISGRDRVNRKSKVEGNLRESGIVEEEFGNGVRTCCVYGLVRSEVG